MGRKDKKNIGYTVKKEIKPFFKGPVLAETHTNVVMFERVIATLLRTEIDRLKDDEEELTKLFSHVFDPILGVEERKMVVKHFVLHPPDVVLGYPRDGAQFPVFAIVLESENESETFVGDYAGESLEGELTEAKEYEGSFFDHTYGVYIYAEHPDVVVYLYQLAKIVLIGARSVLLQAGIQDLSISGGELSPEETNIPENLFLRVMRLSGKTQVTVPRLSIDSARVRLGGLFLDDVVVDGMRGGVHPIEDPTSE